MRPSCLQMAGRRDMEKTNRMPKSGLLPEFSPRESDGPVATLIHSTGVISNNRIRFLGLLVFLGNLVYFTKTFLFFFLSFIRNPCQCFCFLEVQGKGFLKHYV